MRMVFSKEAMSNLCKWEEIDASSDINAIINFIKDGIAVTDVDSKVIL